METQPSERQQPSWRSFARWTLNVAAAWLILWLLWSTGGQLIPFVFGLILAYLLLPLVNRLGRFMPRWAAILVIYLVGIGALVGSVMFVVPPVISQVGNFFGELPDFYERDIQPRIDSALVWYRNDVPPDIQTQINDQAGKALESLKANASDYATSVGGGLISGLTGVFRTVLFLAGFLVIPFWLFYVLLDEEKGKAALDRSLPARVRPDFWAIVEIFDRIFSAYIRGQLILGLIVGLMSYAGLWVIDLLVPDVEIPYKLLLAVVAGFTELIPVIGPILGAVPAVIVGLIASPFMGVVIAALYIVIQQVENNVLVPRIIGGVVEIHAAMLMLLLVIAASVWGLLGVILSAPLAAVVRDVYRYLNGRLRDPDDPRYLPAGALPINQKELKPAETE